jgi:hypothetical protein
VSKVNLSHGAILDHFLRRQTPATLPMISDDVLGSELSSGEEEPIDLTPSIEDTLIEAQEQQRKCKHLAFARLEVGEIEFRAVTKKHMAGKTLKEIGASEGRSATWAYYRVHCGERQLRDALLATSPE